MRNRKDLRDILRKTIEPATLYFQPSTGTLLTYPCGIYKLTNIEKQNADNIPYILEDAYSLTYISKDPDDQTYRKIASLPKCYFDRSFTVDNLTHWVFTIYF